MFSRLGRAVARWPFAVLGIWAAILFVILALAPSWQEVADGPSFGDPPDGTPTRVGEELYGASFAKDLMGSSVFVIARRTGRADGLLPEDRAFIQEVLKPAIRRIGRETGQVRQVRTAEDPFIGRLLDSEDGRATLVLVELAGSFLDHSNRATIHRLETAVAQSGPLVGRPGNLFADEQVPPGLELQLSGPAAVARDMEEAAWEGASAAGVWAVLLAAILLVVVYRSPTLAVVPLLTACAADRLAAGALTLAAQAGLVAVFPGVGGYVSVLVYATGIGAALVLAVRYREELDSGGTFEGAMRRAIEGVGPGLLACGAVTACSFGALGLASLGRFHQAGLALGFSAVCVTLAVLSVTPALLLALRRWAFWPHARREHLAPGPHWPRWSHGSPPGELTARLWGPLAERVRRHPRLISLCAVGLLVPLAGVGVWFHGQVSYGLLSELPPQRPSVVGARAVQDHFPAGATGPVTVLVRHPDVRFDLLDGRDVIGRLSDRIARRGHEIGLADIRSFAYPLGLRVEPERSGKAPILMFKHHQTRIHYVADEGPHADHLTKLDIVLDSDPFSRSSARRFARLQEIVREALAPELAGAELHFIGPTATVHDLQAVARRDRAWVNFVTVAALLVVSAWLLRGVGTPLCLVAGSVFAWLVAWGVTFLVFRGLGGESFPGIEWKVHAVLFNALTAIAVTPNILLAARFREERRRSRADRPSGTPLTDPLTEALASTGGVVSAGGVIAAAVLLGLCAGGLSEMRQFGVAMAVGVLLQTFLIRPFVLAPWLARTEQGTEPEAQPAPQPLESAVPRRIKQSSARPVADTTRDEQEGESVVLAET